MNPYHVLGLGGDATEAEVKRAYARLLKQHRPDSDPVGFQRLHEAYTHCLSHARYRAEFGAELYDDEYEAESRAEESSTEVAAAGEAELSRSAVSGSHEATALAVADASSSEPVDGSDDAVDDADATTFSVEAFVEELLERACDQHPGELSRWLREYEALYSLQLKQLLVGPVASALAGAEPLPPEKNIHTVLEFFGLDGVGQLHWVEHSLQVLWQRIEDRREFESLRGRHYVYARPVDRMLFNELVSPRNWLRFLAILLCPSLPSRTRNVLVDIEVHAPYSARARLNPEAAAFWRAASDRDRLDWRRWLVVLLRLPLLLPVLGYLALVDEHGVTAKSVETSLGGALAIWFALATGRIGWRRLLRFNAERLHWDMPLVLASFTLAVALSAGFFLPDWSIPLSILTLIFWFAQRKGATYYAGLFAAAVGGALVLSMPLLATPKSAPGPWTFVLSGVYGAASILLHDVIYARIKRQPLVWARAQLGWLGWLLLGNVVLVMGVCLAAEG